MTKENEFMTNPVTFLRNNVLSPPDGTPGDVLVEWDVQRAGNILTGDGATATVSVKKAGAAKQWATFVRHGLFPGCLSLRLGTVAPEASSHPVNRAAVPMWWLPWESMSLVRFRIPPVPTALENPREDDFPRFFMTAGINGCSVMIEGPPDSPTIVHAGINGKLARPADQFWLEQMREAQTQLGTGARTIHGVHKGDYMGEGRPEVQRFLAWKNGPGPQPFQLEVTSCFGSLIGVRYGRHWTFYLQQNVYTQQVQVLKRDQVEAHRTNTGHKYYTDSTGTRVDRVDQQVPGRVFGTRTVKTFIRRSHQSTAVLNVGEVYPTRSFNADFRGAITVRS